ncbi:alanine/glycine:cation symporter family protein [Saccharicrinis aurantiacus]|uniref:alanine/glycine:cation symporter family protein n=1 Tax=Saccharicrinis aurantiacus TaxID=1849719 RepID=UPI0009500894|nr:alanine/glycine:cation symporter family protein [Saccharicrinis aurantiacus]
MIELIGTVNNFMSVYLLIPILLFAGLFFTYKTGFLQFRYIGHMFKLLTEGSTHKTSGVTSFQAFTISLGSRVGTGNLAGVALAIVAGGPGAVFWMWLIALLGAASAFVESTLAQAYKVDDEGGTFKGGPAYYMQYALKSRNLGIAFAILITLCYGFAFNSVQSDTISAAFAQSFDFDPAIMGGILVVLTGLIIFGGVRRIAHFTNAVVPVMAISYILVVLYVLFSHFSLIPETISLILESAFGMREAAAGAMGAALVQGIKRGLFSNEAGMGSAPNAAAAADVTHPVKQGFIQALGVFTDTLIICTSTALLLLLSGEYTVTGVDGIRLTQNSMVAMVGPWGGIYLSVCIFLFAFSSIIGNYYYGESNIKFISTKHKYLNMYRGAVLAMVLFGALAKSHVVWGLADIFMILMALLNLYAIFRLTPKLKLILKDYMKQKKEGKDPVFKAKSVGIEDETECWK